MPENQPRITPFDEHLDRLHKLPLEKILEKDANNMVSDFFQKYELKSKEIGNDDVITENVIRFVRKVHARQVERRKYNKDDMPTLESDKIADEYKKAFLGQVNRFDEMIRENDNSGVSNDVRKINPARRFAITAPLTEGGKAEERLQNLGIRKKDLLGDEDDATPLPNDYDDLEEIEGFDPYKLEEEILEKLVDSSGYLEETSPYTFQN